MRLKPYTCLGLSCFCSLLAIEASLAMTWSCHCALKHLGLVVAHTHTHIFGLFHVCGISNIELGPRLIDGRGVL